MANSIIQPEGWTDAKGYANGVLAKDGTLYVGGQIGWDETQTFQSSDFIGQMEQALTNILAVVKSAGGEAADIVRLTWYVTDKKEYLARQREVGEVYRRILGRHFPAMAQAWAGMTGGDIDLTLSIVDYPHTDATDWDCATQAAIQVRRDTGRPFAVVATLPELMPEPVARDLMAHVSNLYQIPQQQALADRLVAATFADTVFFTNSGTEACELAVKMARKYWHDKGQPQRTDIVTFEGAFHGYRRRCRVSGSGRPQGRPAAPKPRRAGRSASKGVRSGARVGPDAGSEMQGGQHRRAAGRL